MKLAVITHVLHYQSPGSVSAYAPYVKEMNLWFQHTESVRVVAPLCKSAPDSSLLLPYEHNRLKVDNIPAFSFVSPLKALRAVGLIPFVLYKIFMACLWADHIHLRCPGNVGLLGCGVQLFFPHKTKTAKYAGNWDSQSSQPLSYRMQKGLLNCTFLTRKMQVLVYGQWPGSSKNIRPFFTATYREEEKTPLPVRSYTEVLHFIFAGTLSANKQPDKALEWIFLLRQAGFKCVLDIYGDGPEKQKLTEKINALSLQETVRIHGNQTANTLKAAYQNAHFLLLPSLSEGWPKVVAEAMFWGCIPICTPVSCVPWMLGEGQRGLLLQKELEASVEAFSQLSHRPGQFEKMAEQAALWSRAFTLDAFDAEIKKLLSQTP